MTTTTNNSDGSTVSLVDSDVKRLIGDLAHRVQVLEETENVKRFMAHFGRWLDRVELTCSRDDMEAFCDEKFAPGGYMDMAWGKWGPDREQLIESFLGFAGTGVRWALHYYFHQEVDLNGDCTEAHFHAQEMVPIKGKLSDPDGDDKLIWFFVENDSDLRKVPDSDGNGLWKMQRYGLREMKLILQDDTEWPDIKENPEAWMFKHSEHPQLRSYTEIMKKIKPLDLFPGADVNTS
jgi:hypothetical protein